MGPLSLTLPPAWSRGLLFTAPVKKDETVKIQTRIELTLEQIEVLILEAAEVETKSGDTVTTIYDEKYGTLVTEISRTD